MAREIKRTPVGAKIREYRKKMHLTQEFVSAKLGVKRNTYARYETDTIPPINILTQLCTFFGITADELLGCNGYYNTSVSSLESSFISLASVNTYNNDNGFTREELETLLKIISMSKDKREQLIKYIESVVEDENLL